VVSPVGERSNFDSFSYSRWVGDLQDVIGTAKTSRTPNLDSVVVSLMPKLGFLIWERKRLVWTTFPSAFI